MTSRRLRLLSIGPLPPTPSGVADYHAELLPHLAAVADVTPVVADDAPQPAVPGVLRVSGLGRATRARFDLPVHHLGNHRFHAAQLPLLAQWPGLVVLHDGVLHHLYADVLLSRGRRAAYVREVAFAAPSALIRATAVAAGEALPAWFEQPALGRVAASARGVIVHSHYALRLVRAARPRVPARVLPLGVEAPPSDADRAAIAAAARRRFDLPADAFVVGTFGALTEEKRVATVVAGFARFRASHPSARLVLAGELAPNVELPTRDGLLVTGRIQLEELEGLIAAADVAVQLRSPTSGEASAVVLRAMRLGRPVVVSSRGWFGELPDAAAVKLDEEDDLGDALARLAASRDLRARLSAGALAHARASAFPDVARAYVDFAAELLGS